MAGHDGSTKGIAAVAGVLVLLASAIAALFALFFVALAAQAPDAFVPNGDPCCGSPDTWRQEAVAAAEAILAVGLVSSAIAFGVALLSWSRRARWPRLRTLGRLPVAAVAAVIVLLVVVWLVDSPRLRADCGGFTVRSSDWRSASTDTRLRTAEAIARCGSLNGMDSATATGVLGRPTSTSRSEHDGVVTSTRRYADVAGEADSETGAHNLDVYVRNERVSLVEFSSDCC